MLAVLKIPPFRNLLFSSHLFWFGMWIEVIAIGWVALELTNSPFLVALVGFFRMLPLVPAGIFSGIIIDRFGRRRIIVTAQSVHLIVSLIMVVLFLSGRATYWHIVSAVFLMGVAWSLDFPARRSLIPDLVGKARTADAILWEGVSMNAARVLGPIVAGTVLHLMGATGCFLLLSAVSLSSLFFLRRLPSGAIPQDAMPSRDSPFTQLWEGFRYARRHQTILAVLLVTMTANLFVFPYMTLLPVFARDVLDLDATGLGILGMAVGLGALPGIAMVYGLKRVLSAGRIYSFGTLFFTLAITLFAASSSFVGSFTLLFIAGVGHCCFGLMQSTLILTSTSDEMRNRAMGLIVLAIGFSPLGQLLMGSMADKFGAPFAVQASATMAAFFILLILALFPRILTASISPISEAT